MKIEGIPLTSLFSTTLRLEINSKHCPTVGESLASMSGLLISLNSKMAKSGISGDTLSYYEQFKYMESDFFNSILRPLTLIV